MTSILSVQSSVVFGYVGNKAATFPLQLLGCEVSPINSCQLSNHTGYPHFMGSRSDGEEMHQVLDGLRKNGIDRSFTHILSGYIATVPFLNALVAEVGQLLKDHPKLTFVCDPVLGDDGALYVPKEFVEIYRDQVVPMAHLLTPNQFESEMLTGMQIKTLEDAQRCCLRFHEMGVGSIVITSCRLEEHPDELFVIGSTVRPDHRFVDPKLAEGEGEEFKDQQPDDQAGQPQQFVLRIPLVDARYVGTGDLTSALILARLYHHSDPPGSPQLPQGPASLLSAVELAIASVQAVIAETCSFRKQLEARCATEGCRAEYSQLNELRLVQSARHILDPEVKLRAQLLPPVAAERP